MTKPSDGFSVATFDIESTSLDAVGAGVLLCAVVKPMGNEAKVFRYDAMHLSPGNDMKLVRALVNELCRYDLLVGHNIERFDWNFIRTRAMIHGIPIPTRPCAYDTLKAFKRCGYLTVPNMIGRPTARLDHVVDMFGIEQEKTALYPREHWKTVWGKKSERKEAMDKLVEHCVRDVSMNEEVFKRMFPMDSTLILRRLK